MRRNLKLIGLMIKLKLSRMMAFRFSFFGAFFVDGSMFAIELLVFTTIYANVESIGGWSRAEMTIFIGTFSLINALNMVIYFFGVLRLPYMIFQGDLDQYLTHPMSPLLRISLEQINPGSLPLVIMSFAIIGYGVSLLPAPPTALQIACYALLVLLMTVLWYDMEVILRCIPFFAPSAQSIADPIEGAVITLSFRVPGVLYKGIWKVLFYFVLPYGIMATIPTQAMAGTLTPGGLMYAVGVVALFTWFTGRLWKWGLSRYQSASS